MKIYKKAGITKVVKWECPVTGIYLIAIFENGAPINGYEIYESDGSFVHNLENFFHASNWAKKHLDNRCDIPNAGKKIADSNRNIIKTANNINVFDAKNGIGAVPDNQAIDYKGFKIMLSPSEFRSLVPNGVANKDTANYIVEALKRGEKIGQPFLVVEWDENNHRWDVIGHEGRSRSLAFEEVYPGEKMEVHILPIGMRARNISSEMKNAPFAKQYSEQPSKTMKDSFYVDEFFQNKNNHEEQELDSVFNWDSFLKE